MRSILPLVAILILSAVPASAHHVQHHSHSSMFYYWRLSSQYGHAPMATWYGPGFIGRRTACGSVFTGQGLTAAHRTLPCGSVVRVTNLVNHRSISVTITDRGPYRAGAVIDLSWAAERALGATASFPVSLSR